MESSLAHAKWDTRATVLVVKVRFIVVILGRMYHVDNVIQYVRALKELSRRSSGYSAGLEM